ncbi:MAG: carbohydrate-binding family 9-like protein [Mucilaginibacter sp.]
MIRKLILSAAFCIATSFAIYAQTHKLVIGEQPLYKVAKTTEPMTIDGKMDEAAWKDAQEVSFDYFYRGDNKPMDKQKTKFRMMWDNANMYLFYTAQDTSLTFRETKPDGRPYLDDCAEFFVLPVPDSLNMHFGFEINIAKAAYDYIMFWQYVNKQNIFVKQYNAEFKVAVTTDGTINNDKDKDKGWTMEIAIPFSSLGNFQRPRAGAKWAFQAVRQDRNLLDDRFRSTATLFPIYDARLDVHQPNRFGLMEFEDKK